MPYVATSQRSSAHVPALLRSRPAAVCRQLRFASHHQAPHTGRLTTTA